MTLVTVLADAAIRTSILAAGASLVLSLHRTRRAAVHSFVWTTVLCVGLAMPVILLATARAGVDVPLLPRWADVRLVLGVFEPAGVAPSTVIQTAAVNVGTTAGVFAGGATDARIASVLLAVYLAGLVILSFRAGAGWVAARAIERRARPMDGVDVPCGLAARVSAAGLSRVPRIVASAGVTVPIATSVIRPTIVLPEEWAIWSRSTLDGVLAHELAHVSRRDVLRQRLVLVHAAVFWFSPLSWWLVRRLAELAEQACDDAALSAGVERTAYAEMLLAFLARPMSAPGAAWQVAMARTAGRVAERRMDRILTWEGERSMKLARTVIVGTLLAATSAAIVVASLRAQPASTPSAAGLSAPMPRPGHVGQPVPSRGTVGGGAARPTAGEDAATGIDALPAIVPPSTAPAVADGAIDTVSADTLPKVLTKVDAKYTAAAMRQKIQGDVEVEATVLTDGTVGSARVAQSLDDTYGLDDQALVAVRQWTFAPATHDGTAVVAVVKVDVMFRLH